MKYLVIAVLILFGFKSNVFSQLKTNSTFNSERLRINKTGMIVLSSWAGANLAVGSIGWALSKGEMKYFHQMNVFWNIVNLGIAVPGLFQSKKSGEQNISNGRLIKEQYSTEQIYLINNGLNVLYIGSGALLRTISESYPKNELRYKGYGNALMLQGSFLLVFDLVQYLIRIIHEFNFKSILGTRPKVIYVYFAGLVTTNRLKLNQNPEYPKMGFLKISRNKVKGLTFRH